MIKRIFFLVTLGLILLPASYGQINSHSDYIEKLQELRTISQKLGIYYITHELYPTKPEFKEKKEKNIEEFNKLLVELTENAPDEEIMIELQKLNLTWLYVNKIISKTYERALAGKILDKLEEMQLEIQNIIEKYLQSTKERQAKIVEKAADTRVQLQRMILYYLAHRAKVYNTHIPERFNDAKNKFKSELDFLEKTEANDESTLLILDMVKNQYKSYKNIDLNSKINPLTAVLIAERMDEDLKMLVDTYRMNIR